MAPPGNATNDWLCTFLYSIAGAAGVCALLILGMLVSAAWCQQACLHAHALPAPRYLPVAHSGSAWNALCIAVCQR